MTAQNVWTCFSHYRKDAAKEIAKLFGNDLSKILGALENYSDKDLYVGHASRIGKTDQGENASLKEDLAKVGAFLKQKGEQLKRTQNDAPKPKGPDLVKKASSQQITKSFTDILRAYDKDTVQVGPMKAALDKEQEKYPGTDWQKIREVWTEYTRLYTKAKGKAPTKS
jgi:hypothetical protein